MGWQSQPNGSSVQSTIENALSKVLKTPTPIVGCGRTDAGVHARSYYAHFDHAGTVHENLCNRLNGILPSDISIKKIFIVDASAHARYDATERTYHYHIIRYKDPFRVDLAHHHFQFAAIDQSLLQKSEDLLLQYDEFFPFCKTHSGVDHYRCQLTCCKWQISEDELILKISANRFLRGMVRLIVGMCTNVALKKILLDEVKRALDTQSALEKSLSAPAHGLFLTDIKYPFID